MAKAPPAKSKNISELVSKKIKESPVIKISIRISNTSHPMPTNNTAKNILKIDLRESSVGKNT